MKLTDYLILLVIVALPMFLITIYKADVTADMMAEKERIDYAIDKACDDAAAALLTGDIYNEGTVNLDSALEAFNNSIYASFGALSNSALQYDLQLYVPVILVTTNEGYYVHYKQAFGSTNVKYLSVWSERLPYKVTQGNWTFYFHTVDNKVRAVSTVDHAAFGSSALMRATANGEVRDEAN